MLLCSCTFNFREIPFVAAYALIGVWIVPPWSFPSSKSCYLVIVMDLKIEVQWMLNNFTYSFFPFHCTSMISWRSWHTFINEIWYGRLQGMVLMLFCWMLIVNLGLTWPKKKECIFWVMNYDWYGEHGTMKAPCHILP
jgi:hypothetical protein